MRRLTDWENTPRLLLQFHITGRCNLQCKHCYRTEGDVEPLSLEDIKTVVEQYKSLRLYFNSARSTRRRGHVNITGGEPFIRNDIKEILTYLGENREHFSYGILSNGSFLDEETVSLLKKTQVSFVQLSIDGDRETHDALRAPGDYDRVFATASFLEKHGVRTYISFTANRENFRHLPSVAKECRKRKITKLWSDRMVPIGTGAELEDLTVTKDQLPDYIKTLKKATGSPLTRCFHPKTAVTLNRALQFLSSEGDCYSCSAGNTLITVDEFGNVFPCRRMPIPCGNVFEHTLEEIYLRNETFRALRLPALPKECEDCPYTEACRGGAKCQSYALYGSFRRADPACPLKKDLK